MRGHSGEHISEMAGTHLAVRSWEGSRGMERGKTNLGQPLSQTFLSTSSSEKVSFSFIGKMGDRGILIFSKATQHRYGKLLHRAAHYFPLRFAMKLDEITSWKCNGYSTEPLVPP